MTAQESLFDGFVAAVDRARAEAHGARDVSLPEAAPSPAMTTEPRCKRRKHHLPHDWTGGHCPGRSLPPTLPPEDVSRRVADMRKEIHR